MNNIRVTLQELEKIDPQIFLGFTDVLDGEKEFVKKKLDEIIGDFKGNLREKAVKLFYAVRDGIHYTMYAPFLYREDYAASSVLKRGSGYCVQKAVTLATFYRMVGIPAALIFADIVNHRAPKSAIEFMGTNIFTYHGYVALYLEGKWIKVTPAFDRETSLKAEYPLVEFDGYKDAIFLPKDEKGRDFIEYQKIHGAYFDLPLEELLASWRKVYGNERVKLWEKAYQEFMK